MKNKLILLFLCVFNLGISQQFSLEDLQTNEHIEIALDSAYQWMENNKLKEFTDNYLVIDNAIEISKNKEYEAKFSAYQAAFYYGLYDNHKFNHFLNRALSYYKFHSDKETQMYIYNLKGLYESNVNFDIEAAIMWHKKAIDLVPPGNEKLELKVVDVYYNITLATAQIKNWDASYDYSAKCIELAEKYNPSRLPRMHYQKGLAQLNTNDFEGAMNSFNVAEKIVKKTESTTGKKVYFKNALYLYGFSDLYAAKGECELSSKYLRAYNARVNENIKAYLQTVGERIQDNSKLLVGLAKKKEEKAEEDLRKSEILILGLAILIIIVLLIFIFQKRKHEKLNIKKNSLLTAKNSELIAIKEEVENALKVKTDFLNSITHELRTPLYAINSIAHMIKDNTKDKIDTSQIDILTFSGDHLLRFINDVIDYNLGASNHEFNHLKLENIDLQNLLYKIEKTIEFSLIMNNENEFKFNFDSNLTKNLKIDSLKLSRIIINLLNNASKYTQGGTILFTAKQLNHTTKTSTVKFSIKDTGKGISKHQFREINLAFNNNLDLVKRIDNTASGLGMGLIMVNRLLKLHNSELNIESEIGKGTTMSFIITFTIDTSSNELPKNNLTANNKQKKHILIVDDNKINQMVTSKIIKNQGNTCDIAKGGEEAITLFKENNNYDFILMDIMMPGMNGFEATEIIKELQPAQKVIALTAISLRENKQKFIDAGFEYVIEKPFKIEKFNELIT